MAPLAAAGLAYTFRKTQSRSALLLAVASLHTVAVGSLWLHRGSALGGWLMVDDLGLLVLSLVSVLFLVVAFYAVGYVRYEKPRGGRAFVSCLLAFLSATSLVALSQHLALLWVEWSRPHLQSRR